MTLNAMVSVVAILGSLVLVWRGLSGRQVAPGKRIQMAVIWLLIIVGAVFLIQWMGLELAR